MTTLRAFQNEMDEIHAREVARHKPPNAQLGNRDHPKDKNITQSRVISKGKEDDTDPLKRIDSLASGMAQAEEEIQVSALAPYQVVPTFQSAITALEIRGRSRQSARHDCRHAHTTPRRVRLSIGF